ncbi:hypothetical protein IMCC3317_33470 [Kordia antarctica]|uniref:Uncharacterized protein n=1 Tax=Kordia antarctica TaxID=1218801 RepID=A0A7L4ZQ16_9FLAO|nr:hypothetical protein [Kordia antarctica]QHI37964.1 hypothetical protein IMCC3317_33470 [Kordia antarctica]
MFTSPFKKLSNASEKRLLLIAFLIFLLAASCMIHFDTLLKNDVAPLGIISFELASTLDCSTKILNSWQATEGAMNSAAWSLWFDYIFMFAYGFLLCLIIHRTARIVWKQPENLGYRLGIVLLRMVIFAVFLDAVENFALLQLFYGDLQSHWSTLAFATATIKFINIIFGILYVIVSLIIVGIKKTSHVKK